MEKTLEKLWNEYFSEECAALDTDEERALSKKAAELEERVCAFFSEEQREAVQKYADALCDLNALYARKAFCKGCMFAVSFLMEASNTKRFPVS